MSKLVRTFAPMFAMLAAHACSDPAVLAAPTTTDVDAAHSAWVANRPSSYVFDVAVSSSWVMPTPYYRVTVEGGHVVSALNAKGSPAEFDTTIDHIWEHILTSRASNQLNSAEFDARGVPIEVDYGPWPVDGGVHYSVRNFSAR
jgi:hypothetical protein